jgi:phosphinothricin acetyltransferase
MDIAIETLQLADWACVRAIYLEGIATGQATFEQNAPDWETWTSKQLPRCRLIARHEGRVIGWAALTPYSTRAVYAGVAEVSLYVAGDARGRGAGRRLLAALVECSEAAGIWTLQAGIFPENGASVRVHELCGFRVVGRRDRIGQMNGQWRDVLLLERRSQKVGL